MTTLRSLMSYHRRHQKWYSFGDWRTSQK